ncbi:MAG: phosphate ABC transporter permease subunit PstC [Planctomycetota bacterium]|nr:phosphate ABC transporter permease subunit PstC [Planctomycetota bacterium]
MVRTETLLDAKSRGAAAGFDRPLLLTAREDAVGFAGAHLGRAVLFLLAATSVVAVLLIFVFIIREAVAFFVDPATLPAADWTSVASVLSWLWAALLAAGVRLGELLGSTQWYPEAATSPEFGVLAILLGSLYVSGGALVVAVPVGLLAAVCMSDILPFGVRQAVKPIVEILAAIPSVAYGFFAVLVVAPLIQEYLHVPTGTNILNTVVILAIMAIPTIVSVSEDALTAAGRELREASYACGATRAETMVLVVIPAAHSGIIAAVILGMMRAIGETMVVWMASGNAAQIPSPWWDITQSVRTMTATIAGEMGETVQGSAHFRSLFAIGLLLLAFTFALNLVTEHCLRHMRQGAGGAK